MKLTEAIRVLKSGGVIAYPTETTYGLGCDPRDTKAVDKIFRLKRRDAAKSVLLVASSIEQVRKVAVLSGPALRLAKHYWPGALTLVLPVKSDASLSPRVSKNGEVAIRVSSSVIVQTLTKRFGFPIVSTSANLSGQSPCRSARSMQQVFAAQGLTPDLIVDGGRLPARKPSTIVRVTASGELEVLRQGAVRPVLS